MEKEVWYVPNCTVGYSQGGRVKNVDFFAYVINKWPLNTYAKFSEKLTFCTFWYAHARTLGANDLLPSNFLKAVFHKIYLVHYWILCLIYACVLSGWFLITIKNTSCKLSFVLLSAPDSQHKVCFVSVFPKITES